MTIWLTADTHFNHANILTLQGRPFKTTDEMNTRMIFNWNSAIQDNDEVWFLGDIGMDNKLHTPLADIFSHLRGRKHLIRGNHDDQAKKVLQYPWESVQHYKKISHNKESYILCHYPLASWDGQNKGRIHFHGHCHGTLREKLPRRYDVGVDVWGYMPQNLEVLSDSIKLWDPM